MIRGLHVHIAGSASPDTDRGLLDTAHTFVRALVNNLIARGAGVVLGAGDEPRSSDGVPYIFDWTALEAISDAPDPAPEWPEQQPERFAAVASQRGLEKVPTDRASIWDRCKRRGDFELQVAPPGWRMAGIIRQLQILRGDVLVALGGGSGVEHLAAMYLDEGKPVVPVHCSLGALNDDGNGGSLFLHKQALADSVAFFRLRAGAGSAAAHLTNLRLAQSTDPVALSRDVASLLGDLRPRTAFYVRLLDTNDADHTAVDAFFRNVVDPVVHERGFTPFEMGRSRPEAAFMNVDIFKALHRAGLVIVDLTGVRPNCMMELGYAMARRRRFVISAIKGTVLPFDEDKLPTFRWSQSDDTSALRAAFLGWFDLHSELPPVVQ